MATLTTEEAVEKLTEAGVWHEVVRDYDGLLDNPQVDHLQAFTDMPGSQGSTFKMLSHPVRYDGEVPPIRTMPPALGEQTREVLAEAGVDAAEIDRLIEARVVVQTNKMRS